MTIGLLIAAWILSFHACAVTAQEPSEPSRPYDAKYHRAYRAGISEANQELKDGKATLYFSGLTRPSEFLDSKTGLPLKRVAGCVPTSAEEGLEAGHNMRISEYIAENGLPENSFKRWEKDLFDLTHYYLARTKTGDPIRLQLDGPAATSPDGKFNLRLVPEQIKRSAGTHWDTQSLVISGDKAGRETIWLEGKMDFFWGPPESGFAVIRSYHRQTLTFTAVDLKRGRLLREEYLSEVDPPPR
jgi:hypothetical protein